MTAPVPLPRRCTLRVRIIVSSAILAGISLMGACSSNTSQPSTPQFSGNTQVSMVLTSTANDQLTEFDLGFQAITLTSQSGKTATLLSPPAQNAAVGAEFMHVNGLAEPLLGGTVPQGIYTSATVALVSSEIVCAAQGAINGEPSVDLAFYQASPSPITVTFATPITITGASMALSLDLLVSQSATFPDCLTPDGFYGFSIAPTFSVTPLTLSSSPIDAANGKVTGLDGEVTALAASGNSLTISIPELKGPRSLSITYDGNTVYQGIPGSSSLAVRTFLNLDGAIQSDGSVLASRIAVQDPSAGDVVRGPLLAVFSSDSAFNVYGREQQGKDFPGYVAGFGPFTFSSAVFKISGQLPNLASLPFVPNFSSTNLVPGQEVYVSAATIPPSGYPVASTVTLMPQTINGTVLGSSQVGSFTDYTVSLASYDFFPMLAVQPGQTTVENNPGQVEIYVDSNTQSLASQPLTEGSNYRFYGLVFNDNGTLRMDCAQVSDGVAFQPQSSASQPAQIEKSIVQQVRAPGNLRQVITTNKP
jgi:Domain of unknown function (DUF5666)